MDNTTASIPKMFKYLYQKYHGYMFKKKKIVFCQMLNPFDNLHLIGMASRTIDLAVSIKVIIELFGLVSKNCVPV